MLSDLGLAGLGLAGLGVGFGVGTGRLGFGDLALTPPARPMRSIPTNSCRSWCSSSLGLGYAAWLDLATKKSLAEAASSSATTRSNQALVATTDDETGIRTPSGSNIGFGLAMAPMWELFEDLCIVRGINMATLSHGTGGQYFNTGKFRGLTSGSSAPGGRARRRRRFDPQPGGGRVELQRRSRSACGGTLR